jgi:hypothetical protein
MPTKQTKLSQQAGRKTQKAMIFIAKLQGFDTLGEGEERKTERVHDR